MFKHKLLIAGFLSVTSSFYVGKAEAQVIDDFNSPTLNWTKQNSGVNVNIGLTTPPSGSENRALTIQSSATGTANSTYSVQRTGLSIPRTNQDHRLFFNYKTLVAVAAGKTISVELKGTATGSSTQITSTYSEAIPASSINTLINYNINLSAFQPNAGQIDNLTSVKIGFTNTGAADVNETIDNVAFTKGNANVSDWNLY